MPSKHTTRSNIADEVPGVEYEDYTPLGDAGCGLVTKTREREFTKDELLAIHDHLTTGLFAEPTTSETAIKPVVRGALRRLMDNAGFDGFGSANRDRNPLRARELLTVLTGCKDANENLRWRDEDAE